jgi:hypothetical protein
MKFQKLITYLFFSLFTIGCTTDPSTTNPSNPGIDKSANLKTLGASANELLSDTKFTSIAIEIVYVSGFKPTDETLNNLNSFLQSRTHKPDGISITTRAVTSSGKAPFTIEEIAEIEKKERLVYNAGDEIAVYIYFADGSNEDDTNQRVVLGSAFRNTSIVIYGKTVQDLADRTNAPDKTIVESTVLNHEFGHLFGLVDVGSPMQNTHEDPDSEAHCDIDGCLMNANVQFGTGIIDVINGNNIPPLDNLCIIDLQANGGK